MRLLKLASTVPLPSMHYCFDWRRDDTREVMTVLREVVARLADFCIPQRLTSIGERQ